MAEDYLTVIWKAYEWPGGRPSTTDIAARLGVTPSTVSANLRRLDRDELVDYEPYGTVTLRPRGEQIAVELVRRHRIIETYLVERLGLGWDEVHREADLLEHAVSDVVLERMDAALGHPYADPHGDVIPRGGSTLPAVEVGTLAGAVVGSVVEVVRVDDRSPSILRYLADKQIAPGSRLRVVSAADQTGAVLLRRAQQDSGGVDSGSAVELSTTAADTVWVRADTAPAG